MLERIVTTPSDEWPRVKAVFNAAVDRPAAERAEFLTAACGSDIALRRMVESLLSNDRAAETFLERPAARDALTIGKGCGTLDPSLEIQTLLRQRLRTVGLIGVCGMGTFYALRFLRVDFTPTFIWRSMVPGGCYLVLLAVCTALLWSKRAYSLHQLRLFEAVMFGLTAIYYTAETYNQLFVDPGWLVTYAQRHPAELSILARQPVVNWMPVIVAYGTFIPNTGRRCAAAAIAMALCPLVTIAVADAVQHTVPLRALFLVLAEMTMWLGVAVGIAVYGSHKIAVLREEAMAARKLGQYELRERIGHGGMGDVYLAEHVLLKRPCAVKVIRPERTGDPATLQRFLREVRATATLTHPNTVQVYDYGQSSDGTVFYAMEYLTGLSLEELVSRDGPMAVTRAVHVLRQICGALAEAHGIGLIHRDIKPSNVILCARGGVTDVAKLLDFGLVAVPSEEDVRLTQAGHVFGTPAYMSPEQAAGRTAIDARSDVYSLGALAYFLVTGTPPFVRNTAVETMNAHINQPAPPLGAVRAGIPRDFEAVVARCLEKSPDRRFENVAALERALAACVSERMPA